jgi:hypothetical protein
MDPLITNVIHPTLARCEVKLAGDIAGNGFRHMMQWQLAVNSRPQTFLFQCGLSLRDKVYSPMARQTGHAPFSNAPHSAEPKTGS